METHDPTDAHLVARTLAGDRPSYGLLYDRYARIVRAVICGAGIPWSLVEDLTQECFLRAYRKLRSLEEPERVGGWIVGIARHVAREQCRAFHRDRHKFAGDGPLEVASSEDFVEDLQVAEDIRLLRKRLDRLPEKERLVIHAFFLDELKAPQAAELLNLSRSGFYALLQRALGRLAKMSNQLGSEKHRP